jgi:serine/threonine-protein kinase
MERLGPFEVIAEAHRGNFTTVLRCRDEELAREVAVRFGADDHIERDARVRASIDHANLLPLFRLLRAGGRLLAVGPWLSGGRLADRLGTLSRAQQLRLARELGAALDALAARGLVHADLNSSNVLFGDDGRAVLCDFSSVKAVGEPWSGSASPLTISPEAWSGAPIDERSDLYGLGVLLYRELVGRWPFEAGDLHLAASAPPPSTVNPQLGAALDQFFTRALAKSPRDRFASGGELARELAAAFARDQVR